jgi:FtsP/CotA-like multicopper oxidase with cupredoxin domain/peroxiredoxin/HEAT repeat protein
MRNIKSSCLATTLLTALCFQWPAVAYAQNASPATAQPSTGAAVSPGIAGPLDGILLGRWTYRSFRNNPTPNTPFNDLRFGEGVLMIESLNDGVMKGRLDFGPEAQVALTGAVTYGNPPTLQFQGRGISAGNRDWLYDYVGHLAFQWPQGEKQVPALVGTIVRSQPHSGGAAPAGVVASWVALKIGLAESAALARKMAAPGMPGSDRSATMMTDARNTAPGLEPRSELQKLWADFAAGKPAPTSPTALVERQLQDLSRSMQGFVPRDQQPAFLKREEFLPERERESLAAASTLKFRAADVSKPEEGIHTLRVQYSDPQVTRIGEQRVRLRTYNGQLVGPTIRCKPGETLRVRLENTLDPNDPSSGGPHNTLRDFNTTNLHFHGLHVSPSGAQDNVFLEVTPGGKPQLYEVKIPPDHPCGTFWYHAHRHGSVAAQLASGMAGALIIEGGQDERIAIDREEILLLQQIPYVEDGALGGVGVVEKKFEAQSFPPAAWDTLQRFTTVNGQRLPVFTARPGELLRWRLIDGAIRQPVLLRLVKQDSAAAAPWPASLTMHEFAVDGLPLGKLRPITSTLEMHPGYRSDVLIQVPADAALTAGQTVSYYLVDERRMQNPGGGTPSDGRKFVARLDITGAPVASPKPLPDEKVLDPRPKSIPEAETAGKPVRRMLYAIAGGFRINGQPYDPEQTLEPKPRLNDAETWELTVQASPPVIHPFHIHVNAFEIFSISRTNPQTGLFEERISEPLWRDTIAVEPGWTVKFRTRYEDFAGKFVQHCHILDHEDQGMMMNVEIVDPAQPVSATSPRPAALRQVAQPYSAPAWRLREATGREMSSAELRGQPAVVFFFRGHGCLHCSEQVRAFSERAEAFRKNGIRLVGITTDRLDVLQEALRSTPCPFPLLADPEQQAFRAYGCGGEGQLHGTFMLDPEGWVLRRNISPSPFMAVDSLLEEPSELTLIANPLPAPPTSAAGGGGAPSTPSRIEIEVRNTASAKDDYLTWAPAPARIRLVAEGHTGGSVQVVLTNDPQQPVPPGRDQPLDGDFAFATAVAAGETAKEKQLALELPADGSWVPFILAGNYPRSSSEDQDAVIEVHAGAADGPVLHRHRSMVRIRKDHRKLTDGERHRFLSAVSHLHRNVIDPATGESRYMFYVRMHRTAAVGFRFGNPNFPELEYYWPDLAHKGPGFTAWHRAFLLQFERDLQKDFPDVALPYWVLPEESKLFTKEFLGENEVSTELWVNPTFATDNPLWGWTAFMPEEDKEPGITGFIRRFPKGRKPGDAGFPNFLSDQILFETPQFVNFSRYPTASGPLFGFIDQLERNPHNPGHNWTGEWMQNCRTSPRDPIFWVFHTGFDRQWARWQYLQRRFDPTGAGDSYCPLGDFNNPVPPCGPFTSVDCVSTQINGCVPVNHRLNDKLWPWNGLSGKGASKKGNYPQASLATPPYLRPFPFATIPGLWPEEKPGAPPVQPTVGDMIDFLGLTPGRAEMGFAYDETPYGMKPQQPVPPAPPADPLKLFADTAQPPAARMAAAARLHPMALDNKSKVDAVLGVLRSTTQVESVRMQALRMVQNATPEAIGETARLLASPAAAPSALAVEAVKELSTAMMFTAEGLAQEHEIVPALEKALSDPRESVRIEALRALAPMGHSERVAPVLAQALAQPAGALFTPSQAIRGLISTGAAREHAGLIRPHLESRDPEAQAAAVAALAADPASRESILKLLADPRQPEKTRSAAVQALLIGGADYFPAVLGLAADTREEFRLRAEAIATIGAALRSLSSAQLQAVIDRLGGLPSGDAQRFGNVLSPVILSATQRLKQPQP